MRKVVGKSLMDEMGQSKVLQSVILKLQQGIERKFQNLPEIAEFKFENSVTVNLR